MSDLAALVIAPDRAVFLRQRQHDPEAQAPLAEFGRRPAAAKIEGRYLAIAPVESRTRMVHAGLDMAAIGRVGAQPDIFTRPDQARLAAAGGVEHRRDPDTQRLEAHLQIAIRRPGIPGAMKRYVGRAQIGGHLFHSRRSVSVSISSTC